MAEVELRIGENAPAFSLQDQDDKVVGIGDFRGKWIVVYFYPKDDTPGCTIEANDFTKLSGEFDKLNAVVWGISPDTIDSHCRFTEKYKLRIRLLSDPEHKTCEKYGVWKLKNANGKEYFGVQRSTFIIDTEGKLAFLEYGVKPDGHASEVLEKLKELQR